MTWQIVQSLVYMGRDLSQLRTDCEAFLGINSTEVPLGPPSPNGVLVSGVTHVYATEHEAQEVAECMMAVKPGLELFVKSTLELDVLRAMAEAKPRRAVWPEPEREKGHESE